MRLFRNRSFAAGAGIALSYFAGFISLFFVLSLYLQIGLGRSALYAGLTMLPFAAGTFAGASASDRIAQRLGRSVLLLGAGLVILGMTTLILTIRAAGTDVTGLQMLPSLLIGGIGSGLVIAPNVDIVLSAVPWRDAGSAGGVLNAAQRIGQALGIAIVGVALFGALGPNADNATAGALAQSYTHAVQVAAYYSLGAVLLAFLLVFLLPRR